MPRQFTHQHFNTATLFTLGIVTRTCNKNMTSAYYPSLKNTNITITVTQRLQHSNFTKLKYRIQYCTCTYICGSNQSLRSYTCKPFRTSAIVWEEEYAMHLTSKYICTLFTSALHGTDVT